jgi:hypothetical protein
MNYEIVQDPELAFNERLRMEFGWDEVASGLGRVMFGYVVLVLGVTLGLGMVMLSLYGLVDGGHATAAKQAVGKPSNVSLWLLYLGLGILSIIGLISYGIVVGGQFRCMLGAAERHGSRWFMFVCIACLFFGPAFEFASGVASFQSVSDVHKNPQAVKDFQLNPLGQWLHIIGFVISMAYPVCFVLFLRSVAVCLRAEIYVMLVNAFLVLAVAVIAGTCYTFYQYPPGAKPVPPAQLLLLAGSWGILGLLYFGLIMVIRGCVVSVMGNLKSPLDT